MLSWNTLQLEITAELVGERIDKALASHPEIQTRSRASRLIVEKCVTLNSLPIKASHRVAMGEVFDIRVPEVKATGLLAYDFPLEVIFEDSELIVINKPAGLVVHPSAGHANDTLVNALIHHSKDLSMGFAEDRPGIIHRLDKPTSGLLVIAKNDFAQNHLAQQFKARTIHRLYWAIVHGLVKDTKATIISFLRRHPTDRKKFASERSIIHGSPQGKRAVTHFTRQLTHPLGLSLVQCRLETGRTHQIRVHLSERGHPIVGDRLYGSGMRFGGIKSTTVKEMITHLNRIGLHAAELGFVHPKTGAEMKFSAPWPPDLLPLVEELKWN